MMTTTSEVKKSLEKAYDKLTPQERARVASAAWWKMADAFSRGEDTTEQQQEQRRFVDRYVDTLTNYEFIQYLFELGNRDEMEWGRRYYSTYIQGLTREDALIELLLVNLDRRWVIEIMLASKKEDGTPEWTANRDEIIDEIKILRERKRTIAAEIDAILMCDFWDTRNMERPARPDIDPEGYPTIYEEATQETAEESDGSTEKNDSGT